jgi:hypothetical protein
MSTCTNCSSKAKVVYGGYCKNHRKEYLLDDSMILIDRFTCEMKDYTLPELKNFFTELVTYFNSNKYRDVNISSIIRLQSIVRRKLLTNRVRLRGTCVLNRSLCNNDEDFYTYDPKDEIEDKYFFSYKDSSHNYWCFDIRSLKKLIDMNYGNPYTTEPIPDIIKDKVHTLISKLLSQNIQVVIDNTVITDRKLVIKQKFVDIFSQIEVSGYSCNIDWVLNLSVPRLKRLYRELEDIWNYRAGLSQQVKCNIAPPHGQLFVMPVHDYMICTEKLELLEILGNELMKIMGATSPSDMNLGFMYFIMGLSIVNQQCLMIHPWVHYAF